MNKYRIKFSKLGRIRFIGHLDLLKTFQRAIKRADLPISYSEGFNPHQKISFALPLPLGMESVAEYLDVRLDKDLTASEVFEMLRKEMPIGIDILNVYKLKDDEKSAASIVCAGEYEVILQQQLNVEEFNKKIDILLNLQEINIEKQTKKRGKEVIKTVNIRSEIYEIKAIDINKIKICISTGSIKNLKPDVLMKYIFSYFDFEYDKCKIYYKRLSLMKEKDGKLVSLDELS